MQIQVSECISEKWEIKTLFVKCKLRTVYSTADAKKGTP